MPRRETEVRGYISWATLKNRIILRKERAGKGKEPLPLRRSSSSTLRSPFFSTKPPALLVIITVGKKGNKEIFLRVLSN